MADPHEARHFPSGEVWQYMGAAPGSLFGTVHAFRHRCHPVTQRHERREYTI